MVCSSSMKTMVLPSSCGELLEHRLQALLEFAAVLGAGEQRRHVERPARACSSGVSGTSPLTMRCARPSTIAVLPTPGSPISTGLFLVRRCRIWMHAADLVVAADHRVELALAGALGQVERVFRERLALRFIGLAAARSLPPRTSSIAFSSASCDAGCFSSRRLALVAGAASRNSSEAMYWSPRFCASLSATLSSCVEVARDSALRPACLRPSAAASTACRADSSRSELGCRPPCATSAGDAAVLLVEQREQQVLRLECTGGPGRARRFAPRLAPPAAWS